MQLKISRFATLATCLFTTSETFAKPGEAPQNAVRIHFKRGAVSEIITSCLTKTHDNRYYKIKTNRGQRLSIKVDGLTRDGIVPLLFLTSPSGVNSTEKTVRIDTYATEGGDYLIRIAPNMMASNGTIGRFVLKIRVR